MSDPFPEIVKDLLRDEYATPGGQVDMVVTALYLLGLGLKEVGDFWIQVLGRICDSIDHFFDRKYPPGPDEVRVPRARERSDFAWRYWQAGATLAVFSVVSVQAALAISAG